jgi:hypothetical protein
LGPPPPQYLVATPNEIPGLKTEVQIKETNTTKMLKHINIETDVAKRI